MERLHSTSAAVAPAMPGVQTPSHEHPTSTNVLNRLHALFSTNAEAGPSRSRRASAVSPTEPAIGDERIFPERPKRVRPVVRDRDAIKIKICSWNMGDALPKGDLSVLLGNVPDYQPLEVRDGLPIVPLEDLHPYHLVIIAGQECPTESGVPRGLGGGLIKGMKLHGMHKKGKDKDKDRDKDKDKEGAPRPSLSVPDEDEGESSDSTIDGRGQLYPGTATEEGTETSVSCASGESAEPSRATTPTMGYSSSLHRHGLGHGHGQQSAVKGWSSMLDDWLCGSSPRLKDIGKGRPAETPSAAPGPGSLTVESPMLSRSASIPLATSDTLLQPGHMGLWSSHSPLARSPSSFSSISRSSSDSSASDQEASTPFPISPPSTLSPSAAATMRKMERPEIIIPPDDPPQTGEGSKCYVHLTKQRLMGMYLSVYVHKDCRHLIGGTDKDFVTAGLAGGRLGNKGGIGISLKFAEHRLLFVNSHLAAHTGRNAARMANIAKIKSELSLDCFLPRDDPRFSAQDLTDRYDSVFWCGDLNFRLDVARLHAEWLVEHKKYAEALTWDQLRNAMKDPSTNPFVGFEEGVIDFPPTFKYDVWRSVKTTNKNLRRSIRRKNSVSKPRPADTAVNTGLALSGSTILDHVPEMDGEEARETAEPHTYQSDDGARSPAMSRRSLEINRSFDRPASAAASARDYEAYRDGEENGSHHQAQLNGVANSHRPLEAKLKQKTKVLLKLVNIKTHLSPLTTKSKSDSPRLNKKPSMEFDQASRRTSLSSLASYRDRERETSPETPLDPARSFVFTDSAPQVTTTPTPGLLSPIEVATISADRDKPPPARRPSTTSSFGSPQRPGRSFSLKRTLSGRSTKLSKGEEEEDLDMGEDRREGVYDSSKKQRVPSWCDRVLWKAHPIPDVPEHIAGDLRRLSSNDPDGPRFARLSLAFSNLGMHLKSPLTRTITTESSLSRRSRSPPLSRGHQPTPLNGSPSLTLVDSPGASTEPLRPDTPIENGQVPPPKNVALAPASETGPRPNASHMRSFTADSQSKPSPPRSPARHPLLQTGASQSGSPARPRITIDPASSPSHDRITRPRANSESTPGSAGLSARAQLFAASPTAARAGAGDALPSPLPPPPIRRLTGEPAPRPVASLIHADSAPMRRGDSSSGLSFKHRARTMTTHPDDHTPIPDDGRRNAFQRFIHDLPGWLHRSSSAVAEPEATRNLAGADEEDEEGEQVKRHMKGEVVCLHYGTIDDAGMRLLEGRSDHRPAIFAAAIYI